VLQPGPTNAIVHTPSSAEEPLERAIVLLSGGLDSAVLLAQEARRGRAYPLYIRVGLAWEASELRMIDRLLAAPVFAGRVEPLLAMDFNMRDIYPPSHWAIAGKPPAYDSADEEVYLPGRNLVLLTKAGVSALSHRAHRIVLGPLGGNPFPDATPAFFAAMSRALSLGLDHAISVEAPLLDRTKEDVIRLGNALQVPLELTLSCMNPVAGDPPLHCGLCSKCRERRDAFAAAAGSDPTPYAHASPR
jgi:7-cyano-7-deazaguanine synthase